MIIHDHIVTSQYHQKKDGCCIYRKCPDRIKGVGKPRCNHKNRKNSHNADQSMCRFDSEIRLPEHKHSKQYCYSHNAVVTSGQICVQRHHRHTECHHKVYLEVVDQNMAAFFFRVCGIFDQLFRTHRTQLKFLIKSHKSRSFFCKV